MTLSPAVIKDCEQKLQQLLKDTDKDRATIVTALKRMEQGTYGVCPDCNNEIMSARLQSLPTAKRCVRCEDEIESRIKKQWAERLARNTISIRC